MNILDWVKTDIQKDILEKKYFYKNETLDQWFDRVSGGNETIKKLIIEKKFMPAGRILANRGLHKLGKKITYSNCFVVDSPIDTLESIFECASKIARTFSYGGGVGVDLSKLSPRGAKLNNAAKETTGAVSFMDLYSLITGLISQSGRRGALMISLDCNHPDLEEFIEVKSDLDKITKANISVKITDEFMQAVKNNKEYLLSFYRQETGEEIKKIINARELFNKFSEMNWDFAEPGMIFWTRIKNWNLLSEDKNFEYIGLNPCCEEPLPKGGSCILGSINLTEFIINPFTEDAYFDFFNFGLTVMESVKYLNEILDEGLSLLPLQEQRESVRDWRQIGIGIMSLGDMLIKLGLKYGSDESIELCDKIGFAMINYAIKQSALLAKEQGSYPMCNKEAILNSEFFKYNIVNEDIISLVKEYGLRNSQLLTCAPTGTLSTLLNVSGGIEPIYELSYQRKTESLHGEDVYYTIQTPIVEEFLDYVDCDKNNLPDYFVTAMNINYKNRIDMQSIWQTHIDASISSTVNVPNDFTVEEVEDLYMYAWKKGLKGITIYRSGCKREGILFTTTDDKNNKKQNEYDSQNEYYSNNDLKWGTVIESSDDLIGRKRKIVSGCGSLHCTAFFDPIDGRLMETYLSKGSSGGCNNFMVGLSRMISFAARHGADVYGIVDQLNSCGVCPSYAIRKAKYNDVSEGTCCPVAIGKALIEMHNEIQEEVAHEEFEIIDLNNNTTEEKSDKSKCPECGNNLKYEMGCISCNCGFSKCG